MKAMGSVFSETLVGAALLLGSAAAVEAGDNWPPVPVESPKNLDPIDGRKVETYRQGPRAEWGYASGQWNTFHVVHPRKDAVRGQERVPLYVVLHSAGHGAESAMRTGYKRSGDGSYNDHGLYRAPDGFYGLHLQGDSWWGRDVADAAKDAVEDGPVEKRVLDTVAWVVAKYGMDPDRVYLAGISMGGSGGLGIGMRHGDVFASTMVWVPAGTGHVARRMFFGGKAPEGLSIPDPPVVVNISAQNDGWSKGQDVLIRGVAERKFALVMGWGPFGHSGQTQSYVDHSGPVMAFPWLEIRKNEAYPVFTGATSDQKPPWIHEKAGDSQGQINAYFRWKNIKDTATAFSMRVWIEHPVVGKAPAAAMPKESVADLTLRRLQNFKVPQVKTCSWELVRDGKPVAAGVLRPDAAGLLTIPAVRVTTVPADVNLTFGK